MKLCKFSFYLSISILLGTSIVHAHLCDNVFRQPGKLIVKPENYNMVVKEEATFKIFLQNNMDRGIAEISLLADSPAFDFKISPEKMTLPKDQKVFFTVTMHSKDGVKTGYYPIHFRLVGGGREFESFSLDVQSSAPEKETEKRDMANLLVVRQLYLNN